jgi:hypothetical protein
MSSDKEILRKLSAQVKEVSEKPVMTDRERKWTAINDLKTEGPMILVSPEGSWREINALLPLECEDEIAREFELALRQKIYHHEHICDDWVIDATFDIPIKISDSGYGLELKRETSDMATGAFKYIPPITDLDRDMDKLRFREITIEKDISDARFELAQASFGDILNVSRNAAGYFWTTGMTGAAISLIGLEELMLYMFDNPDGLKRFMQFMSNDMSNYMDQLESLDILGYNNGNNLIGSGNWGLTSDLPSKQKPVDGPINFSHLWGFCESQETVGVSPEMFAEFIFPYQKPLIDRFGLTYYGCCEPVEDRFNYIKQCDNLRCISVSPWSDVEKCAELYGRDYVLCHKPNPGLICVNFAEEACRKEIRNVLDKAKDLNVMFILKDTHTISHQPERFKRWVAIAREEIEKSC